MGGKGAAKSAAAKSPAAKSPAATNTATTATTASNASTAPTEAPAPVPEAKLTRSASGSSTASHFFNSTLLEEASANEGTPASGLLGAIRSLCGRPRAPSTSICGAAEKDSTGEARPTVAAAAAAATGGLTSPAALVRAAGIRAWLEGNELLHNEDTNGDAEETTNTTTTTTTTTTAAHAAPTRSNKSKKHGKHHHKHFAAEQAEQAAEAAAEAAKPPPAEHPIGIAFDLDMMRHCGPEGHPERPARIEEIVRQLEAAGLLEVTSKIGSRAATVEELRRVHDEDFVEKILNFDLKAPRPTSHGKDKQKEKDHEDDKDKPYCYPFGPDTYVNEFTADCAKLSAGTLINLVDAVMDPDSKVTSGMAVIRPPGHHATANRSMGFCLFNNVAVAARHLQAEHGLKKIAIIDWDVHHGNGTSDIFVDDPDVLFFSMHRHEHGFFPGTGVLEEAGHHDARGYTVNVPLEKGFRDVDVVHVMRYLLCPLIDKFQPEAIFVSAGFDAVRGDPLGGCLLTPEGFGWMTRCLYRLANHFCNGRLFLALEGGYDPDLIAQCTVECVQSMVAEANGLTVHQLDTHLLDSMSPTGSHPDTPNVSAPATPASKPMPSPKASVLVLEHLDEAAQQNLHHHHHHHQNDLLFSRASSGRSSPVHSPPGSPHPTGGRSQKDKKKLQPRQPFSRTIKIVRHLTEIHHLLPLKLPIAPPDLVHNKNARKNEKKKNKKHQKHGGDHHHDDGHDSDDSGWAIATAGTADHDALASPTVRALSRQISGEDAGLVQIEMLELPPLEGAGSHIAAA